jgi:hypothetical protein
MREPQAANRRRQDGRFQAEEKHPHIHPQFSVCFGASWQVVPGFEENEVG